MAKQCIFCGRPLAQDDARFCDDCGRSQVPPSSSTAAPSAIKVKLPPKEFSRADPPSARLENKMPGQSTDVARSSYQEQSVPQSARMPKRPSVRPSAQEPPSARDIVEPGESSLSALSRFAASAPAERAQPAPVEEISTMVMPGWREELALLRKEQEQASASSSVEPEKKAEDVTRRPSSTPQRSPTASFSQREMAGQSSRTREKVSSESTSADHVPAERARPEEVPSASRRAPGASFQEQVRQSAQARAQGSAQPELARVQAVPERTRPKEAPPLPRRPQNTPGPVLENARPAETSRQEFQAKVREQEATKRYSQARLEKQGPGPAPAVEQNPLASISLDLEKPELVEQIADVETVRWQTVPGPLPVDTNNTPARAESQPSIIEADEEKDEIEDLPTVPLAVPEVAKREPQITVERASTPAPKNWGPTSADDVDNLPTRPMAASSAPAARRSPAPSTPPPPSGDRRPGPGQPEAAPGVYGSIPAVQPMNAAQAPGTAVDPLAERGRSANPSSQPGQVFNPASLPPLPHTPISLPGNTQLHSGPRPSTPFPDSLTQRPPQMPSDPFAQRSPSFAMSAPPDTPRPAPEAVDSAVRGSRQKRPAGRVLVLAVVFLVILGGAAGTVFNWPWVAQFFVAPSTTQPYQAFQNNTFGVSLSYPQAWKVQVDQAHNVVHFVDSSQTGQINLSEKTATGQINDYLNQQTAQLGIASPKTNPAVTFAGSSWQEVQGTVTQNGAAYTIALYVTQHNGHFYSLTFLAPVPVFGQMETNNFAPLRSSFRFM